MEDAVLKNHDRDAPVALVKWKQNALAEAIDLCDGLKHFDPDMKIPGYNSFRGGDLNPPKEADSKRFFSQLSW